MYPNKSGHIDKVVNLCANEFNVIVINVVDFRSTDPNLDLIAMAFLSLIWYFILVNFWS